MKQRFGFVSNSSSSSFVCMLTLEAFEKDYHETPAETGVICCVRCNSYFYNSALNNYGFKVNPNDEGYIDSSECPVCLGRVIHKVLKEDETFEIVKKE